MSIDFRIDERLAGFAASAATAGQQARVVYRELIAPDDASHLLDRLDRMQRSLFHRIPGLPSPSTIDHLLVVIRPDLSATAYVNELRITAQIRPNRPMRAGEPIFASDVEELSSVDLGVEIPESAAVVLVRSKGWRHSLFYDFGPIHEPPVPRDYELGAALAEQALLLMGLVDRGEASQPGRLNAMADALRQLETLLVEQNDQESTYQELFESNPWMLGGLYRRVTRHRNLDDTRIPDFTAQRSYDGAHDIIEIKQPFMTLFRRDGRFTADFHNAWNQSETYLAFCQRQRSYLWEEKRLRFENPRCILITGHELPSEQRRAIREKESLLPAITVWTYNEILDMARNLLNIFATAAERPVGDAELEM